MVNTYWSQKPTQSGNFHQIISKIPATPKENKQFNSRRPSVFLFGKIRLGTGSFRIEVLTSSNS